ncbi:MAG: DUF1572 family protein [Lewinellaceae bacterium]|nr:DUF1572 family protein [Lewinella sp.]MCB9279129.1 DUF1572 family protein [Lewinellaceae bacterium]
MLFDLFIREIHRRLIDESLPRLRKCLGMLDESAIWYRPNVHSNTVGNLVLHLHGNVRQWLGAGLMKMEDVRMRQTEFDEEGPISSAELLARMAQTELLIETTLKKVRPEDLTASHRVQGFEENGVAILVHVTEHFSYHVGQITYITKALKDLDTGYFAGIDLEKKD